MAKKSLTPSSKQKPMHSVPPPLTLPPQLAPPVPVIPPALAQIEKLMSATDIENAVGLKKTALYRLGRQRRCVVYRTGKRGGLRYLLSEVLAAIRQPMQMEPETATKPASPVQKKVGDKKSITTKATGGGSHD